MRSSQRGEKNFATIYSHPSLRADPLGVPLKAKVELCAYWSKSTQSWVPSECAVLGAVKVCAPLLGKEPIAVGLPVVGSYQEAVMDFEKFAMLTDSKFVATGVYTTASVGFQAVVA